MALKKKILEFFFDDFKKKIFCSKIFSTRCLISTRCPKNRKKKIEKNFWSKSTKFFSKKFFWMCYAQTTPKTAFSGPKTPLLVVFLIFFENLGPPLRGPPTARTFGQKWGHESIFHKNRLFRWKIVNIMPDLDSSCVLALFSLFIGSIYVKRTWLMVPLPFSAVKFTKMKVKRWQK